MKRIQVEPRRDWQEQMHAIGFDYHSIDGNYWQEDVCYVFSESQIDIIEQATEQVHQMYLQAVAHVVKNGDYDRLSINNTAAELIENSVKQQQASLYGRFDFCFDGINPPKLYEYNADTPTSLFEASVAQWYWLQSRQNLSTYDQFNSIHERLLVEFSAMKTQLTTPLYFSAIANNQEDYITTRYIQDVAIQAGLPTEFIDIGDIGYRHTDGCFVDLKDQPISHLFKLYPWEWLVEEEFGKYIANSQTQFIEPAYKLLMSNKALLAVLWELFPNHPNLLASYLEPKFQDNFVKKPFFSREGASINLYTQGLNLHTEGNYGKEGFVYQAACPLPTFVNNQNQTMHTLVGSWIVGQSAAGIGIREDYTAITKDTSLFVPHIFA